MKKIVAWLLLVLLLSGCGGQPGPQAKDLELWVTSWERARIYEALAESWNEAHPQEPVRLEVSVYSSQSIGSKFSWGLSVSAGFGDSGIPDLVELDYATFPEFVFQQTADLFLVVQATRFVFADDLCDTGDYIGENQIFFRIFIIFLCEVDQPAVQLSILLCFAVLRKIHEIFTVRFKRLGKLLQITVRVGIDQTAERVVLKTLFEDTVFNCFVQIIYIFEVMIKRSAVGICEPAQLGDTDAFNWKAAPQFKIGISNLPFCKFCALAVFHEYYINTCKYFCGRFAQKN